MKEYLFNKDKTEDSGSVIVLGGFDSVHRGHRALIARGYAVAKKLNLPLLVFTIRISRSPFRVYFLLTISSSFSICSSTLSEYM